MNLKIKKIPRRGKSLESLIGQRFGRVVVQKLISKSYQNGKRRTFVDCLCDCGNSKMLMISGLERGTTKSCGCINKSTGKDHYNWDESIPIDDKLNKRGSVKNPLYENWRKRVYERDRYTCQLSGEKGNIVAHHIYSWNKYKNLRYNVDNGIVLLKTIHDEFHKIYGKGNNDGEQFEEFKALWKKNLLT